MVRCSSDQAADREQLVRILVAEDDEALATALRFSLGQAGYAADRVAHGLAADDLLKDGVFDLLILDLGLPRLDGLEVLRRGQGGVATVLLYAELAFDTVSRTVTVRGKPATMSVLETSLVEILLRRFGRVVSKDQLVEQLYNYDREVSHNAIEVYIHRVRKKLAGAGVAVRTSYGRGYLLDYESEEID